MTSLQKHVVLVVDDEPLLRMVAADWLNADGFAAIEADGADHALSLLAQHPEVSILLTDIQMPGRDGLELARAVYAQRPDILLILTSGMVRPADGDIPDHGRFLAKPYGAHAVRDLVAEMS